MSKCPNVQMSKYRNIRIKTPDHIILYYIVALEMPKQTAIKHLNGPAEANLNVPKSPELTTTRLLPTTNSFTLHAYTHTYLVHTYIQTHTHSTTRHLQVDKRHMFWTTRPRDCVVKFVRFPKASSTLHIFNQTNQAPHKSIKSYRYAKRINKPTSCLGSINKGYSKIIHLTAKRPVTSDVAKQNQTIPHSYSRKRTQVTTRTRTRTRFGTP